MQVKTRFPRWAPSAWLRPIIVVLFPSPSGVGVMAVTSMYLPLGTFFNRLRISSLTLALKGPWSSSSDARIRASEAISAIGLRRAACAMSMSEGTGRLRTRRLGLKAGLRADGLALDAVLRALDVGLRFADGLARALGMGLASRRMGESESTARSGVSVYQFHLSHRPRQGPTLRPVDAGGHYSGRVR